VPLNFEPLALPLSGPDERSAALLRAPGTLDRAINVRFSKLGDRVVALKRFGYELVPIQGVGAFSPDAVWSACASTPSDELLLFGHRWAWGLGSADSAIRGDDAAILRGPVNRGNARATFVSQSRLSQEVEDDV
jgi:hypothetical protein